MATWQRVVIYYLSGKLKSMVLGTAFVRVG
jgi:hypothetical protein